MKRTMIAMDKARTQTREPMVASRVLNLSARMRTAEIHVVGEQWREQLQYQQSDPGKGVSDRISCLGLGVALGCSDLRWMEPVRRSHIRAAKVVLGCNFANGEHLKKLVAAEHKNHKPGRLTNSVAKNIVGGQVRVSGYHYVMA